METDSYLSGAKAEKSAMCLTGTTMLPRLMQLYNTKGHIIPPKLKGLALWMESVPREGCQLMQHNIAVGLMALDHIHVCSISAG